MAKLLPQPDERTDQSARHMRRVNHRRTNEHFRLMAANAEVIDRQFGDYRY